MNCSTLEAIGLCEEITGGLEISLPSSVTTTWELRYDVRGILEEIYSYNHERWAAETLPG